MLFPNRGGSICGKNIFNYVRDYGKYILSIFICVWLCNSFISSFYNVPRLLNDLLIVTGVCALFYVAIQRVTKYCDNTIVNLGETSFFIYVFHTCFIFNALRFIIDPISMIPYVGCTFAYFLSFFIRVILCVAIYYMMKYVCPKILAVLVGNRGLVK